MIEPEQFASIQESFTDVLRPNNLRTCVLSKRCPTSDLEAIVCFTVTVDAGACVVVVVDGKTVMLPLFIKPYFARMVTPKRRLALIGEVSMTRQKQVRTGFVLVHGVLKKKKVHSAKPKHLVKAKK